jgi:serine/threonine protein phosphatase PrpC
MEGDVPPSRLYSEQDLEESELHRIANGLAAVYTAKNPEKESSNQDAAAILPFSAKSGVLVIADGAGGLPAGARASEVAISCIQSSLRQAAKDDNDLRGAIINGIENANQELAERGTGAATTLAAVEIQDNTVRPYHVGDSQIMVMGQKGKIKLLTKSHSPVGYAVEAGVLDEEQAMHHEQRHLISNAIGSAEMYIEIGSVLKLAPRDTVVVASDGLFDNLHTEEIVEICRKGRLAEASRDLIARCRARMSESEEGKPSKPDDLSFILYRRISERKKDGT